MKYVEKLAKEIKDNRNRDIIGCIIGKVISPPPNIAISILDGQVIIRKCYILKSALSGFKKTMTIPLTSAEGKTNTNIHNHFIDELSNNTNLSTHEHNIISLGIKNAEVEFNDELKKGDELLLISSQDNQIFFVIGKVEKIGK